MSAQIKLGSAGTANVDRGVRNRCTDAPLVPSLLLPSSEGAAAGSTADRAGRLDMILLAGVRALLAITAFLIISMTPQEKQRLVAVTQATLVVYAIYSLAVMWAVWRTRARAVPRALAWIDVAFAGGISAMTEGTNSIFFAFYFLAVLAAAFTRGFREAMLITAVSTGAYLVAGLVAKPLIAAEDLDRALIRPVALLALGFLMSYWGGSEIELKRRLALLRNIAGAINPREGVVAAITARLQALCTFFDADNAVLAVEHPRKAPGGTIYTATGGKSEAGQGSSQATADTMGIFMAVPERATAWPRRAIQERYLPLDSPSRAREIQGSEGVVSSLAHLLEAKCVTIAGYRQSDGIEGRLVLARAHTRFRDNEAVFLAQCAQTLAAAVENVTLTEELIARSAEYERLSISRDLHDTTIQPYIGLRMALEGVAKEFRDDPRVVERLAQVIEMTEEGIQELRDYTVRLKTGGGASVASLGSAIERQARRLLRFYGLDVHVQIDRSLQLDKEAAAAIFQMVSEGLSNVVRHTKATTARVMVRRDGDGCIIEVANPLAVGYAQPSAFVPRSIAERADDLGGHSAVKVAVGSETIVTVAIPLRGRPR
jgi:signal transduction histidine kinase